MNADQNNNVVNALPPALSSSAQSSLISEPNVSEGACERATYIWELDEKSFPIPIFPREEVIDTEDPDRDVAVSILDHETIESPPFIRGQEVNKPIEWQLQLSKYAPENEEAKAQLVLICRKVLLHGANLARVRMEYETVNNYGVVTSNLGLNSSSKLYTMGEGSRLVLSVNYQSDFLENKKALLDENGILRLRLRLNIYKDLPPPLLKHVGTNGAGANDNPGQPPAKRKRYEYESGAPDLTCLLGSMVNFWKNRENDGNISIRCGNKTFKAHKFILTYRSEVFKSMLAGDVEMKEKCTNEIFVDDVTPEIMNALLEFLYLGDTNGIDWYNVDHICALVYAVDKYWIPSLMNRCYNALMRLMNLENFGQIAKATFMYNSDKEFKDEVRNFFESHQMTLNGVPSFQRFAREDFDEFCKLFFYSHPN